MDRLTQSIDKCSIEGESVEEYLRSYFSLSAGSAQASLQVPDSGGEAAGRSEQERRAGTLRGGTFWAGGRGGGCPKGTAFPNGWSEGPRPDAQKDLRDRGLNRSDGKEDERSIERTACPLRRGPPYYSRSALALTIPFLFWPFCHECRHVTVLVVAYNYYNFLFFFNQG